MSEYDTHFDLAFISVSVINADEIIPEIITEENIVIRRYILCKHMSAVCRKLKLIQEI